MAHAIKQQQHTQLSTPYMGVEITKGWISSNYAGTVRYYATLPNGAIVSSPERKYVTKRIKKFFLEGK